MVKKLHILKSLKGRSLEELRVRSVQKLSAFAERAGLSSQLRTPGDESFLRLLTGEARAATASAEDLLGRFQTRTSPRFFAAFDNREETVSELRRRFGREGEEQTVARAERIVSGHFDLLGLRALSFGHPVDWHLEPVSGKRTPPGHWSRIDYLDARAAGDKKITWELNRHQHFMTLGRAYWYTKDERYARTFAEHLSDWMEKNPPKRGINWASSLEVSFRSIAWLWALHFFRDSVHLGAPLYLRALKFLYLHARHLETYLSTYFSPNTHLTGEALGLFYLGTLLPEFRRARRWRERGRRILLDELERHVLRDGVYFERASYYHRYTVDFYTHLLVLSRANGAEAEPLLETKLSALLDHLMYITRPDGRTPRFGDDDGGRLVLLDERASDDFRATLSTGASLFGRADYKLVAGSLAEETLWLLGREGADSFDRLEARKPSHTSRAFPEGGYYVMRDRWTDDANYLLIDCGPHGAMNCGHAHADALSFEMAARGRTVLVDPGTYTYTGSAEWRDLFRSSRAHNTLVVDGESSSVPAGPFSWRHVAEARTRAWLSLEHFDFFEGEHDGYLRLSEPVRHTRSVLFIKNRYWIMRDRVESAGEHHYELAFHFAEADRAGVEIFCFAPGGEWREEEGFVSEAYGMKRPAPVRLFNVKAQGTSEIVTFIVPRGALERGARVREVEAHGGRAFELTDEEDERDLLLIGAKGVCSARSLESDSALTWVRCGSEESELKELLLIGGSKLSLCGREIVRASEELPYLFVRRAGEELIVETDGAASLRLHSFGARRLLLNREEFALQSDVINLSRGRVSTAADEGARVETFA